MYTKATEKSYETKASTWPTPIDWIWHSESEYQMVIKRGLDPFAESTKRRVIAWRERSKR